MVIEYFRENPKIAAALLVLLVLVILLWIKVMKTRIANSGRNEEIIRKLKEENELRNEFSILTEALIGSSDEIRLFRGVSLVLQKKISDASDMQAEFDGLNDAQKAVYALSFVVEDGGENLSNFFSLNGSPLTDEAKKAVGMLLPPEASEAFSKEFAASDPDDESTSYIADEIEKLDGKFAEAVSKDEIMRIGGKYIKDNCEKFV